MKGTDSSAGGPRAQGPNLLPPPDFETQGIDVTFARFRAASYDLMLDCRDRSAFVRSSLEFVLDRSGHPVIDLAAADDQIQFVEISEEHGDRRTSSLLEIVAPDRTTRLRVLDRPLRSGRYRLSVRHRLVHGVTFGDAGVRCHLPFSDEGQDGDLYSAQNDRFAGRTFLERYFPSNLEFDQYPVAMRIRLEGARPRDYRLFANAQQITGEERGWSLVFPGWYSTSCPFLYLGPIGRTRCFPERPSFNGSSPKAPTVFSEESDIDLQDVAAHVVAATHDLESHMNLAYPHDRIIVLATNRRECGMEYAGAFSTPPIERVIRHELAHGWFGRGVLASRGNAGWIDEGLAYFFGDRLYHDRLQAVEHGIALDGTSRYLRFTPDDGHTWSGQVIALIGDRLDDGGGSFLPLWRFVRRLCERYARRHLSTPLFLEELAAFRPHVDFRELLRPYLHQLRKQEPR